LRHVPCSGGRVACIPERSLHGCHYRSEADLPLVAKAKAGLPNTVRKDKIKHEGVEEAGRLDAPVFFLFTGLSCRHKHCSRAAGENVIDEKRDLLDGG